MRTVYKTKYYTVKKDDSGPTPKYLIYRDGVEVKKVFFPGGSDYVGIQTKGATK